MIQYIAAILLFAIAIVGMALALHFSKYKKRNNSGCCGGGHCETDKNGKPVAHSCYQEKVDFVDNKYVKEVG